MSDFELDDQQCPHVRDAIGQGIPLYIAEYDLSVITVEVLREF